MDAPRGGNQTREWGMTREWVGGMPLGVPYRVRVFGHVPLPGYTLATGTPSAGSQDARTTDDTRKS